MFITRSPRKGRSLARSAPWKAIPKARSTASVHAQASSTEFDRDAKFLAMLPRIRRQAAYYLRRLSKKERADAIQEVVASAFVSYVRLIERGKADLAYAGPLARYGACQYLAGRRVGNRMNGHDVTSDYCQQKKENRSRATRSLRRPD